MSADRLPAPGFEAKIVARAALAAAVARLPRPVVLTNGVFDLLHRGHVTYLAQVREGRRLRHAERARGPAGTHLGRAHPGHCLRARALDHGAAAPAAPVIALARTLGTRPRSRPGRALKARRTAEPRSA